VITQAVVVDRKNQKSLKTKRASKENKASQVLSGASRQQKRPLLKLPKDFRFDPEEFETCCRLIEHEIRQRHPQAAHAALDRFIAACELGREVITPTAPLQSLRSVFGETVGPNQREVNQLEHYGYLNVMAFVGATRDELSLIPGFGLIIIEKMLNLQDMARRTLGWAERERAGT
jgi:hypothetical protein